MHAGYPEPGDCSLRSSSCHRRLTDSSLGRASRSSGFHPQAAWPGRKVHQHGCYGSDRVADRPSALHAEAPRRRGWGTRLAPTIQAGEPLPDRRPPEPLLRRRPPRNFRSDPPCRRSQDTRSQPFPAKRVEPIYGLLESAQVPMFLRVSSFRCASAIEANACSRWSLQGQSTQCGVCIHIMPSAATSEKGAHV